MKKRKRRKRLIILLSIIFVIVFGAFLYFNYVVNPIILSVSESRVRALASKAVTSAVTEILAKKNTYDELITISTDEEGNIAFVQANAIVINKLTRELSRNSQSKLEIIGSQGISIPIGSFTGIPIFMGRGPEVKIRLLPIGTIQCNFLTEFKNAGINQTIHRIYVNINTVINMVLPIENRRIETTSQLLICESIIIGKVPETYLQATELQDMMDLIPSK